MYKVTNIENTPNPDALKFMLDATIMESGSKQFDSKGGASDDPLAKALFDIPGVASVFYMGEFVTVTKDAGSDWNKVGPKVIQIIQSANGAVKKTETPKAGSEQENELLKKINDVIDENVRPALAGDGGGLEVISLDGYTLTIHYQGACGSCPSATAGTMSAIQNLLQRMVDPKLKVVSDAGMMGHY